VAKPLRRTGRSRAFAVLLPSVDATTLILCASVRQTADNQSRLRHSGPPADVDHLIPDLLEVTKSGTGACFRANGGRFLGVAS
jgi:hypothetical protein